MDNNERVTEELRPIDGEGGIPNGEEFPPVRDTAPLPSLPGDEEETERGRLGRAILSILIAGALVIATLFVLGMLLSLVFNHLGMFLFVGAVVVVVYFFKKFIGKLGEANDDDDEQ